MYKILIVDDEEKIRNLIKKYADFEGNQTVMASNGMEAVSLCKKEDFDIIIMDAMMPELDGFSAVKEIKKFKDIPIIMLSARGEEYDKIHGFELGIDDYVTKPFSPKELTMRVEAVLKRAKKSEPPRELYEKGGVAVDLTARTIAVDGKQVSASPKEFELLSYLLKNRNIALSREKIISEVWGYDFFGDDRTLDTHIKLLRKTLGKYSSYIVTLRSVGYRLEW
jgi:DNA-binding response OmpR family regulator